MCTVSLVAFLIGGTWSAAYAQQENAKADPFAEEVRYMHGLHQWGLSDYANLVYATVAAKYPGRKAEIRAIEIELLGAVGKFDEARQVIARMANQDSREAWAMKLKLADALYAWGKYAEARGIYEGFFAKYPEGPPGDLRKFYVESAYKYAQMLLLMGNEKAALEGYRNVARVMPKDDKEQRDVRRQIITEMAELMVKLAETATDKEREEYFKDIEEVMGEILWVQDLWFAKAIVIMSHVAMIKGDVDEAQKLIEDYGPRLKEMDEILKNEEERTGQPLAKLSPMAECRYLLGVMMQEEAEALMEEGENKAKVVNLLAGKPTQGGRRSNGALQHFYNVFIKYPATGWAPDAGVRANRVKEILEGLGAEIRVNISQEQMNSVERYQFQGARSQFNQQQYGQAVDAYIKVLNLFPEKESSIPALSELTRCYIEINDMLYADVVLRYLAERFSAHPQHMSRAGDEVLRIAGLFDERQKLDKKDAAYDLFFRFFQKHPRTPGLLYGLGEKRFADEDYEGSLEYYEWIANEHNTSTLYEEALSRAAFAQSKLGETVAEIKTLQKYIKALEAENRPGPEIISAKFRIATAYKQLGKKYIPSALKRYIELVKLLSDENNPYQRTAEDAKRNRSILEGCMYYKAMSYSMLTQPPEKVASYKRFAIKTLEELVEKFPESRFAAPALSQVGTLWTVLENADDARKALNRLKQDYPDTPEAKNALFMLGNNLLQLGMRQEAIRVFKEMFEGGGEYSNSQILTAGDELSKAGENDIALQAYDKVLGATEERATREPALLGKGEVLTAQEKFTEAAEVLKTLVADYPNSRRIIEANLLLSRAYSEMGAREANADKRFDIFNASIVAMKTVRKFAKTTDISYRSDIGVARIQLRKARAEAQFGDKKRAVELVNEAIATYQTLVLLGNPDDREARPHIEAAYHECIPLLIETERWADVIEDTSGYLAEFPRGKYVIDIRKWQNQGRMGLVASGQEAPAETTPDEDEAPPVPEDIEGNGEENNEPDTAKVESGT